MKINHDELRYISPVDAAIMVRTGWAVEWPWEVPKHMARHFRRVGYHRFVSEARDQVRALNYLGELTERTP